MVAVVETLLKLLVLLFIMLSAHPPDKLCGQVTHVDDCDLVVGASGTVHTPAAVITADLLITCKQS